MPRTFGTGHSNANTKRQNLRPQLESGKSKNNGKPLGDAWLKEKWPELLDAHYQCRIPGPSACLQDALNMITEPHSVQITCPGTKKKEEDEHKEGDEHEPRTLSELEVQVIKEWYDKKDKELEETRGEAYITERNLSTAARQYHNDSMNAHAKTHEGLEDVKKSNADEHAILRESVNKLHEKMDAKFPGRGKNCEMIVANVQVQVKKSKGLTIVSYEAIGTGFLDASIYWLQYM